MHRAKGMEQRALRAVCTSGDVYIVVIISIVSIGNPRSQLRSNSKEKVLFEGAE